MRTCAAVMVLMVLILSLAGLITAGGGLILWGAVDISHKNNAYSVHFAEPGDDCKGGVAVFDVSDGKPLSCLPVGTVPLSDGVLPQSNDVYIPGFTDRQDSQVQRLAKRLGSFEGDLSSRDRSQIQELVDQIAAEIPKSQRQYANLHVSTIVGKISLGAVMSIISVVGWVALFRTSPLIGKPLTWLAGRPWPPISSSTLARPLNLSSGAAQMAHDLPDDSLIRAERAARARPDDAAAWSEQGSVLLDLRRYDEALSSLQRSRALDSSIALTWVSSGIALYRLRRYDEAMALSDEALLLWPNDTRLERTRVAALREIGRHMEAEHAYGRLMKRDPVDPLTLAERAELYRAQGRQRAALADLERAADIAPENPYLWRCMAAVLRTLKRPADAEQAESRWRRLSQSDWAGDNRIVPLC